ncbi:hypothetical protein Krac_8601 [Ktedonobacter racemifer DSM 44963]|uniref:Uncharacterized protein n=1 Tax=Ktedonobacter racemifer DSM 44963 TaxID=485913 RepID=D6TNE0_KTERA|nr:hypothetical protein Krac_8601 [Ktedonobacter racemifer DSM 44963]
MRNIFHTFCHWCKKQAECEPVVIAGGVGQKKRVVWLCVDCRRSLR